MAHKGTFKNRALVFSKFTLWQMIVLLYTMLPTKLYYYSQKSNKTRDIFFPLLYLYIYFASVTKPNVYLREKKNSREGYVSLMK